jgi:methylmalonyl-CoA mutase
MSLLAEFPPISTEQWEAAIQKDLKGADYNKRLVWQTDDGIAVRPYYRAEHIQGIDLNTVPGQFPYTRGTSPVNEWKLREEVDSNDIAEANAQAKLAVAGGAEEIAFRRAVPQSLSDLRLLLTGLDNVAIHLWADTEPQPLVNLLAANPPAPFRGSLKLHPFTDADIIAPFLRTNPGPPLRPVAIRRASFLEAGATTVQEVGFILAAGIDYLKWMTARDVTVDQAANAVAFWFSVGSSYFFQIAKFRAFRMLWAQAVAAFGGSPEAAKACIFARTADWNQSIYDPYNNVLRGATEAMSAALGGVDSLTVAPFDETYRNPTEESRRLARNTQIILKKEAWLDRVTDPAAGSYYVEVLTDSIAKAAWKLMQDVESIGGYLKARDSGMIPTQVAESRKKKEAALAARRKVIVGVNNYPNLKERMLDQIEHKDIELVYGRGAEMFEDIRLRTERHAAAGNKTPLFLLAEIGDLKMRKARSGFIHNFLGCAGFQLQTAVFETLDAVAARAQELKADAVVLCSSDDEYTTILATGDWPLATPLIIAGTHPSLPTINIRSNAVETLTYWQERLGVKG